MANILLWYHTAATKDANGQGVPVIEEPSVVPGDEAEQLTGSPAVSAPAPTATEFAVIETSAAVRYTVRGKDKTTPTANALHKKIEQGVSQISLHEGQTISFIDA